VSRYAAFLRGINLGPTNKVAMPRLRAVAEGLGWDEVSTYINSGNLLFTSTRRPATLAAELAGALAAELGKRIDVAVRSRADLQRVVADNPFPDGDPSKVVVAFLMGPLPAGAQRALAEQAGDREPFRVSAREIYVHYTEGQARSELAARFADVIKVSATTRNIRTVTTVLDLLGR
jgi:uncharacterized protein (DUF1697 family)